MKGTKLFLVRVFFPVFLFFTSCALEGGEKVQVKFDKETAIIDIINQTLPLLMPDSNLRRSMPVLASRVSDRDYKDKNIAEIERINSMVDTAEIGLFLDSNLFVPDSFQVQILVQQGVNPQINRFRTEKFQKTTIDLTKIHDFGKVKLTQRKPDSQLERDSFYGFVSFSNFLFFEGNKKALFIYQTTAYPFCTSSQTNLVEVQRDGEYWKLISKRTDLN